MENLNKPHLAESINNWALSLRRSGWLQFGWGISSCWLVAGTLLLLSRILGLFSPDADAVRNQRGWLVWCRGVCL